MALRTESDFEAMYREHYPGVPRFVARRVEEAQIDDVVGETFLAAWRRRAELPEDVRTWLFASSGVPCPLTAWRGGRGAWWT